MTTALIEITQTHAQELAEVYRDPVVTRAVALEVTDDAGYMVAAEFLVDEIAPAIAAITEGCEPVVSAAHKAHKAACDQRKKLLDPLKAAERMLKEKMGTYQTEKLRRQREEQERLAREAAALEEDARILEAVELERVGQNEQAEKMISGEIPVDNVAPPPAPTTKLATASGMRTGKDWEVTITDERLVFQGIADGKIPRAAAKLDPAAIKRLVKAADGEVDYPGVYVREIVTVGRTGR